MIVAVYYFKSGYDLEISKGLLAHCVSHTSLELEILFCLLSPTGLGLKVCALTLASKNFLLEVLIIS